MDKDFLKFREDMKEKVYEKLLQFINISLCPPPPHLTPRTHTAHVQGYFKVNPWFFVALIAHIIFFQVAAWWVLWYFGNSWTTWLIAAVCVTTAQAQGGWLQHDFGHHTVFNSTKLNHIFHDITIGLMKVILTSIMLLKYSA